MTQQKTPFEIAEDNIRKFAENIEMLHSLNELKTLMDDIKNLSSEEQEGIHTIVDLAIKNLSDYITKKGGQWNWDVVI